jgi:hypothetical protein
VKTNLWACSVSMSLSLSSKENFSPRSSSNSACKKNNIKQSIMLRQKTKQSIKLSLQDQNNQSSSAKKKYNNQSRSSQKIKQSITLISA